MAEELMDLSLTREVGKKWAKMAEIPFGEAKIHSPAFFPGFRAESPKITCESAGLLGLGKRKGSIEGGRVPKPS